MSIFVIGDLHLSFGTDKPMDIFGWGNHSEKIKQNWLENVKNEDTVVIPGDFSWGMSLEEACRDLEFVNNLPGTKILAKGNHDYWWTSLTKMNQFLQENDFQTMHFLHNNSYLVEDKVIVGTRGWSTIGWNSEENYKILKRENERLKLSIEDGKRQFGTEKEIICFLHYPPFFRENVLEEISLIDTMKQYGIRKCYYAHLHGESHKEAFVGEKDGILFDLVSSDYLGFKLLKISETQRKGR